MKNFLESTFRSYPKDYNFFANAAIWLIFCYVVMSFRWVGGVSTITKPLTYYDKKALVRFLDWGNLGYFILEFLSCLAVFRF